MSSCAATCWAIAETGVPDAGALMNNARRTRIEPCFTPSHALLRSAILLVGQPPCPYRLSHPRTPLPTTNVIASESVAVLAEPRGSTPGVSPTRQTFGQRSSRQSDDVMAWDRNAARSRITTRRR